MIRYSMLSGIKLTVLLPTLNEVIRDVLTTVESFEAKMHYVVVLCHSNQRCEEWQSFIQSLLTFC